MMQFIALHKNSKTCEWEEVFRGDLHEVRQWYDNVPQAAKGHVWFRARPVGAVYGSEVYGVQGSSDWTRRRRQLRKGLGCILV